MQSQLFGGGNAFKLDYVLQKKVYFHSCLTHFRTKIKHLLNH